MRQNDSVLLKHVYIDLNIANYLAKNYRTAITYGKKVLEITQKTKDYKYLGYAYDIVGILYYNINEVDSFGVYIKQEIPYIKYRPLDERAACYSNVALYYYTIGDYESEKYYLEEGLSECPCPLLYGHLAVYYMDIGDLDKAEPLWPEALKESCADCRMNFMYSYAKWCRERGDEKRYGELNRQIVVMKDSLQKAQHSEELKGIQDDFDKEEAERTLHSDNMRLAVWLVACIGVLGLTVLLFLRHRKKARVRMEQNAREMEKARTQIEQSAEQIEKAEKRIAELRKDGDSKQRKLQRLQQRVETLRDQHSELIALGKQRFDDIAQGQNTTRWRKQDFLAFLEYYSTLNSELLPQLSREYEKLTPSQKFYFCMLDMHKTDAEIQINMGLSDGAFRNLRYRIGQQKRA